MMSLTPRLPSTALLARLIEDPDLPARIRELSSERFTALVHEVGVADAGELVALATTEQLVAAFDEDLFVNTRPGEREVFDRQRFVTWLEVLLGRPPHRRAVRGLRGARAVERRTRVRP